MVCRRFDPPPGLAGPGCALQALLAGAAEDYFNTAAAEEEQAAAAAGGGAGQGTGQVRFDAAAGAGGRVAARAGCHALSDAAGVPANSCHARVHRSSCRAPQASGRGGVAPLLARAVPFLSCGDLSGGDADRTYDLDPATYVRLEPVQPPTAPNYKTAIALAKGAGGGGL